MVGVIISLLVTIMVVVILLKKMKAQFVLFFGGLTLLVCSIAMDAFGFCPTAPRSFRRASPARASSASTSSSASRR